LVGWLNAPGANRSSSAGFRLVLLADARGFWPTQRSGDSYRAVTMPRWCGFRRRLGDLGDHLVAQMAL